MLKLECEKIMWGNVQTDMLASKDHGLRNYTELVITINTPCWGFFVADLIMKTSRKRFSDHSCWDMRIPLDWTNASQLTKVFAQTQGKLCSEHHKTQFGHCLPAEKLQSSIFCASAKLASTSFHRATSHVVSSCHASKNSEAQPSSAVPRDADRSGWLRLTRLQTAVTFFVNGFSNQSI